MTVHSTPKCIVAALLAMAGTIMTAPSQAAGPEPQAAARHAVIEPPPFERPSLNETKAVYGPPWPYQYVDVRITGSLERTLVNAVGSEVGPRLTQVVKRNLVWWIDVRRELHPNDRLEIVYEVPDEGEPVAHAVWFESRQLKKQMVAVRYRPEKSPFAKWFTPNGQEVELRLKKSPINTYEQITSLLKDGRGHRGMDFKAPEGTPIKAPFSGTVVRRNWSTRRNGLCLELENPKTGHIAYLLHLSSIGRTVRPGTHVKVGQVIARSGNTGRSTAPHLHYQLEKNGRVIDPLRVHDTWRASLPRSEQQNLLDTLARFARLRSGAS